MLNLRHLKDIFGGFGNISGFCEQLAGAPIRQETSNDVQTRSTTGMIDHTKHRATS